MISVLFAAKNSVYKTIPGLDVWDEQRNALKWSGGNPGIFHPPCRLFSALRHMSTAPLSEKYLAYWSVEKVRENGGTLEHPANSLLWKERRLPRPGYKDEWGFTFSVDQFWFGHPSQKKTWLYICGMSPIDLPDYPIKFGWPQDLFAGGVGRKYVPGSRHGGIRSATPKVFAEWLIETAELCEKATGVCA